MAASDNKIPVKSKWGGLGVRVVSSLILFTIAFVAILLGGWVFNLFVALVGIQMWREWRKLVRSRDWRWQAGGILYIAVPSLSFMYLRHLGLIFQSDMGRIAILYLVGMVTFTDTGAYFVGKIVGGPKLAPSISPSKTWAGALGGIAGAYVAIVVIQYLLLGNLSYIGDPLTLLLPLVISVVAQGGDLFESWVKRHNDVKDSGTLIPGHGGLLDRMDGYMFTAPLFALIMVFVK